ncbi:MAG: SPOR domain-containing protein [Bacteroidota bacterium]|nr:SPOR domain-containing protein [Bacteroidota bacterium]
MFRWGALIVLLAAVVLGAFHIKELETDITALKQQMIKRTANQGKSDSTAAGTTKDTSMVSVVIPQQGKLDRSSGIRKPREGKGKTNRRMKETPSRYDHRGAVSPSHTSLRRYLVATGVFPDRIEADALRKVLITHGYPASLRLAPAGWYVVVGPLDDLHRAERYRRALAGTVHGSSLHIIGAGPHDCTEGASLP